MVVGEEEIIKGMEGRRGFVLLGSGVQKLVSIESETWRIGRREDQRFSGKTERVVVVVVVEEGGGGLVA